MKSEKLKVKSVVCTQFNEELVVSNKIRENGEIKENRVDEARVSQSYPPYAPAHVNLRRDREAREFKEFREFRRALSSFICKA
ncbi:MAG: hypothetical protein IKV04_00925 [Alistipes sp.]|nr:hypothetical protein [Alistipes sp.]